MKQCQAEFRPRFDKCFEGIVPVWPLVGYLKNILISRDIINKGRRVSNKRAATD